MKYIKYNVELNNQFFSIELPIIKNEDGIIEDIKLNIY